MIDSHLVFVVNLEGNRPLPAICKLYNFSLWHFSLWQFGTFSFNLYKYNF